MSEKNYAANAGIPPTTYRRRGFLPCGVGEKAGYVPAEHVQFIEDNFERCDGVTHIEAYCGANDIYGAEIIIRFRKS